MSTAFYPFEEVIKGQPGDQEEFEFRLRISWEKCHYCKDVQSHYSAITLLEVLQHQLKVRLNTYSE